MKSEIINGVPHTLVPLGVLEAMHEEINNLKLLNARMAAKLRKQSVFIKQSAAKWENCSSVYPTFWTLLRVAHESPEECLKEIQAEAVEEALDATYNEIRNRIGKDYSNIVESIILEYAAKIRRGGE